MASKSRVQVATAQTRVREDEGHGAAVHVLNMGGDTINAEYEGELGDREWRRVFIDFPQADERTTSPILNRDGFPSEISWVDVGGGFLPTEQTIPNLVALRGVVTDFDVDPASREEEVSVEMDLFPGDKDLLEILRRGSITDRLYMACMRAVNLFPRGAVEKGSSFAAYLAMGYQRIRSHRAGQSDAFDLSKVIWDLQVNGPTTRGGWIPEAWRRRRAVWAPSPRGSELYSPVEAALVMDLHMVLFQLWQARFIQSEVLMGELRSQAVLVEPVKAAHPVQGKSTMRRWRGPDLFPQR
ncbi:hypothetical protein HY631_03885 [Candidatus Uhrbacteria bacterium]|nr:hypothetical protein [Candidatus Uhrbacteria bacterium]